MKKILAGLAVALLVPLASACTKQTTTRTVGLDFGLLSCSVETSSEKFDADFDKILKLAKEIGPLAGVVLRRHDPLQDRESARAQRQEDELRRYKAMCEALFEEFREEGRR